MKKTLLVLWLIGAVFVLVNLVVRTHLCPGLWTGKGYMCADANPAWKSACEAQK